MIALSTFYARVREGDFSKTSGMSTSAPQRFLLRPSDDSILRSV